MEIEKFLSEKNIQYRSVTHSPFASIGDGLEFCKEQEIPYPTNLIYTNKQKIIILTICNQAGRVDTSALKQTLGLTGKISHAPAQILTDVFKVKSGAVSPLGLVNTPEGKDVTWAYDEDFINQQKVGFHPNIGDTTLILTQEDFKKFITAISNKVENIVEIKVPLKEEE